MPSNIKLTQKKDTHRILWRTFQQLLERFSRYSNSKTVLVLHEVPLNHFRIARLEQRQPQEHTRFLRIQIQ